MAVTPLYLDLGAASTAPVQTRPPVPVVAYVAPVVVVMTERPKVPAGPWRGDPVCKAAVMKPLCPQCGAKRNIVIGAAGMGPGFEVWLCPTNPAHAIQTWPVRLNTVPANGG